MAGAAFQQIKIYDYTPGMYMYFKVTVRLKSNTGITTDM